MYYQQNLALIEPGTSTLPTMSTLKDGAAAVWITLLAADVPTMKEAQQMAKNHRDEENPSAKWKWREKGPGDGKRFAVFQCNAHKDCTCFVRVARVAGEYFIQKKGKHKEEPKLKKRKNSTLTYADEEALRDHMDAGTRPAKIHTQLTKKKARELIAQGLDPLSEFHKRPEGGLKGEWRYDTCITYVLCVYYVCIMSVL